MSEALYELGGLRFWNENEIELREMFQARIISVVKRTLTGLNPAWRFERVEGPCLCPRDRISAAYDDTDLFATNHTAGGGALYLRAETTESTYAYIRKKNPKLPFCAYQAGKSFRRELNDGASASKLRFNEFWQLEFQCVYSKDTKCDYRFSLMTAIAHEIRRFCEEPVRIAESDRLPSYSESTMDIEVERGDDRWIEVASCSIRKDFSEDTRVCEIAIGLDRVVEIATEE